MRDETKGNLSEMARKLAEDSDLTSTLMNHYRMTANYGLGAFMAFLASFFVVMFGSVEMIKGLFSSGHIKPDFPGVLVLLSLSIMIISHMVMWNVLWKRGVMFAMEDLVRHLSVGDRPERLRVITGMTPAQFVTFSQSRDAAIAFFQARKMKISETENASLLRRLEAMI